jgi:WD40 repeat protein
VNGVLSVAFSRDGAWLAAACKPRHIWLIDPADGDRKRQFEGHSQWVQCLAFSTADEEVLASVSKDGTVRLWSTASGEALQVIRGHVGCVWWADFSPDGAHLATAGADGTITLWNPQARQDCQPGPAADERTGVRYAEGPTGHLDRLTFWAADGPPMSCGAAFSHGGRLMATGHEDGYTRLWDPQAAEPRALEPRHSAAVGTLAFSRDGAMLATSSRGDGTMRIWDLPSGRQRCVLQNDANIYSILFSSEGRTLFAATSDDGILRWDTGTGEPRPALQAHVDGVYCLALSPDGTVLASGGGDRKILLWDLAAGRPKSTLFGHADNVYVLAFSPDGRTLASGSQDRQVKLWSVVSGHELLNLAHSHNLRPLIYFSPDGRTMITCDRDANRRQRAYLWSTGIRWRPASDQPGVVGMTVYEGHDETSFHNVAP